MGVDAGALISKAYNVKWSQTAINNMKWDGTDEWLDQTADCTSNSPGGDKLRIGSYSTNIPNFGLSMFDDCGNIPGYREEAELTLNAHSISSTTNYWFQMQWDCVYGGASGEINISFEANSFSHDWLDKVNYGCLYGSPAEGSESQNTPQASNPPNDKLQRESLARVDGPLYDYEVSRTQNDRLKARVTTDFASVANLEAYQAYNENLLSEVLRTKKVDEPIFVSITFERPLSTDRARELTGVTQMDVLSYGVFGSKDNEVISTYISPSSHDIEGVPHSDRLMGVTYDGIMNVQGIVNVHGLDKLSASMGDIALIDLTANEIQANVGKATGEHIELEQIAVPSPAWQFYTGSRH